MEYLIGKNQFHQLSPSVTGMAEKFILGEEVPPDENWLENGVLVKFSQAEFIDPKDAGPAANI